MTDVTTPRPDGWSPFTEPAYDEFTSYTKVALYYALVHGWPVFPVSPLTKAPLRQRSETGLGGFHEATTDEATIIQWFDVDGMGMMPGVGFAPASIGLCVVDVDVAKDESGRSGFDTMSMMGVDLPPTMVSQTPSGGRHYFYEMPPEGVGTSAGVAGLGALLDVRGGPRKKNREGEYVEGYKPTGYVVLPGSAGPAYADYTWLVSGVPVPMLPDWVTEELAKGKPNIEGKVVGDRVEVETTPERYADGTIRLCLKDVEASASGGRQTALNKASFGCGRVLAYSSMTEAEVREALFDAAPIQETGRDSFTSAEAWQTINHGLGDGMREPLELVVEGPREVPEDADSVDDLMESEPSPDYEEVSDVEPDGSEERLNRELCVDLRTLGDRPPIETSAVMFDPDRGLHLFYRGALNVIFGKQDSGKTVGFAVFAREALRAGQTVYWLTNEATADASLAKLTEQGITKDELAGLRWGSLNELVGLGPSEGFEEIGRIVRAMNVDVVLVDSGSRLLSEAGANSWKDDEVSEWWGPFETLAQKTNTAIVLIDHLPNDTDKDRPSGANMKNRYQGTYYKMVPDKRGSLHPNHFGQTLVTLIKDNIGFLKRRDYTDKAIVAVLQSVKGGGPVLLLPHAPPADVIDPALKEAPRSFTLDAVQLQVFDWLEKNAHTDMDSAVSRNKIITGMTGKKPKGSGTTWDAITEVSDILMDTGEMHELIKARMTPGGQWRYYAEDTRDLEDLTDEVN